MQFKINSLISMNPNDIMEMYGEPMKEAGLELKTMEIFEDFQICYVEADREDLEKLSDILGHQVTIDEMQKEKNDKYRHYNPSVSEHMGEINIIDDKKRLMDFINDFLEG